MNDQELFEVVLFRYEAVSCVTALVDYGETLQSALAHIAQTIGPAPGSGKRPKAKTIQRWYYTFQAKGYEGLVPRRRKDKGTFRRIPKAVLAEIEKVLKDERAKILKEKGPKAAKDKRRRKTLLTGEELRDILIGKGKLSPEISLSTLYRFLRAHGVKLTDEDDRELHRWEAREPNQIWQADGLAGPWVVYRGRKRRTCIISIIDDHSRMIISAKACFGESAKNFLEIFRDGLCRRGRVRKLYVDNGGAFNSRDVKAICMRLGIAHIAGAPYVKEGRGKIERWHRTLRKWIRKLKAKECRSLSHLEASFQKFVERYNNRRHRTTGMPPRERWLSGNWVFRSVEEKGTLRWIFGRRIRRRVDRAACVMAGGRLYEVSQALRGKWVTVVYLADMPEEVDVEHEGKRAGTGKRLRIQRKGGRA